MFKKISIYLLFLLLSISLVSCQNKDNLSKLILEDILAIDLTVDENNKIHIPKIGEINKSIITFESNLDEISNDGVVYPIAFDSNKTTYDILITGKLKSVELTKTLKVMPNILPIDEDLIIEMILEDLLLIDLTVDNNNYINISNVGEINTSSISFESNIYEITSESYVYPVIEDTSYNIKITGQLGEISLTKDFEVIPNITDYQNIHLSKTIKPFENLTEEYEVADSDIDTYYFEDSDIPYIDVFDFLMMLDGLIYSDELEFSYYAGKLELSYFIEYEDGDKIEAFAFIDFINSFFYVETLDFFEYYFYDTETDYSEGITYLDSYVEEGNEVLFNLKEYDLDFIYHQDENNTDKYLMPYIVANLLFLNSSYYTVYYNQDSYYGIYLLPSKGDDIYNKIKTSSFNNKEIPFDIQKQTYDIQMFILNNFFGLKDNYNLDEIKNKYFNNFSSTNNTFNSNLFNLYIKYIDELHTSPGIPGYYSKLNYSYPAISFITQLGPNVRDWYEEGIFKVQEALEKYPNQTPPNYRFLDSNKKTAIIYLDSFKTASVEDGEEKNKNNDSDAFMEYVLGEIFDKSPNVENIAIDLSYNTGGNLGALLRVLGYMTEKPIEISYQNPLDNSKMTYFAEVETNAYENINWYILSSPVTFSAANLMVAIAKNQNIATIIGSKSGGGASSIIPFLLPEGTMYTTSSNNVLSVRRESNGTYIYESIEDGIEPDIYIAPNKIQDDNLILQAILSN